MATKYAITDLLSLPNSNVKIPRLGFGVYRALDEKCVQACLTAFQAGYRHIDSAQFYSNEKAVGEAVRKSGLPRDDIFITTKIMTPGGSPQATYEKIQASVDKITGKDGHVDLFLIHSSKSGPSGRKEMWQALERLYDEGRTRSIGVSNYGIKHIEEMKAYAKVWPPHVNQIEVRVQLPSARDGLQNV
jgi:diketogulonate reductase-like aldo/keto reductase